MIRHLFIGLLIIASPCSAQQKFELCSDLELQLRADVIGGSASWYYDGNFIGDEYCSYLITSTGVYIFEVVAVNSIGCTTTKKDIVEIIDCDSIYIYFPNAFTPNGDGLNDVFAPVGQVDNWELEIFDQWGKLIYKGNKPWAGNNVADLYAFKAYWKQKGNHKQYTGRVQLVQ